MLLSYSCRFDQFVVTSLVGSRGPAIDSTSRASETFREGEIPCEPSADAGSDGASPSPCRLRSSNRAKYLNLVQSPQVKLLRPAPISAILRRSNRRGAQFETREETRRSFWRAFGNVGKYVIEILLCSREHAHLVGYGSSGRWCLRRSAPRIFHDLLHQFVDIHMEGRKPGDGQHIELV